jgi:hypothetical protein
MANEERSLDEQLEKILEIREKNTRIRQKDYVRRQRAEFADENLQGGVDIQTGDAQVLTRAEETAQKQPQNLQSNS